MEAAREAARGLLRRANAAASPAGLNELKEVERAAAKAAAELGRLAGEPVPALRAADAAPPYEGAMVRVLRLDQRGEVMAVRPDGSVDVALGAMRIHVPAGEVEVVTAAADPAPEEPSRRRRASSVEGGGAGAAARPRRGDRGRSTGTLPVDADHPVGSSPMQLDLRGERVEEALERLNAHLDRGLLSGAPWLHIIHGHGTGAMKNAVRDALRRHPLVARYRSGEQGEGGDGVTIVYLK
jgi:DNA mismatch repair protein MutS2